MADGYYLSEEGLRRQRAINARVDALGSALLPTVPNHRDNPAAAQEYEDTGAFDIRHKAGEEDGDRGRIQVYDTSRPSYDEAELAGRIYTDRWVECAKADFAPQDGIVYVKVVALGSSPRDGFRATVEFDAELPTETVDNPFYTEVIGKVEVKTNEEGKREVIISRSRPLGNMRILGRWL